MANIAEQRIRREFKEVVKSDEVKQTIYLNVNVMTLFRQNSITHRLLTLETCHVRGVSFPHIRLVRSV